MRLTEQETYLVDGERQYAGIWVKNTEGARLGVAPGSD